jgi:DNA invertase Pin-like site-specific DNA recombinase
MPTGRICAAQYLRMSTEHQKYSIEFQTAANTAYALEQGYDLVRAFTDAGISGVTVRGRDGLKDLLAAVVGGTADFSVILVYDVSRWGRFQDPDQAAHYEFICRDAGVSVEYCAETFANDGSLASTLIKSLKRVMAAEYSRELSDKVGRAKRGLAAQGYWQGGPPSLGLRRVSLGSRRRLVMEDGERNALQGGRVGLVQGPPEEVELVRRVFRSFLSGLRVKAIAAQLNADGIAARKGGLWTTAALYNILHNEIYVGVLVGGRSRTSFGRQRKAGVTERSRAPGVVEPIVSREVFDTVQRQFRQRKAPASDEDMLDVLRIVLAEKGRLSFSIIRRDPRTHFPTSYVRRFGSLDAVYERLGYTPNHQQRQAIEHIRKHRPDLHRRGRGEPRDPTREGRAPEEGPA